MLLVPECHSPKAGASWHAWCGGYRLPRLLSRRALRSAASRAELRMRCSSLACSPPHQLQLFMPSRLSHASLEPCRLSTLTVIPLSCTPAAGVHALPSVSHRLRAGAR